MKLITVFLILSFSCLSSIADASSPRQMRHLTVSDGLSSGIVNCFMQDRKGFLWIGTNNGLNRFDGSSIEVFRHIHSQSNSMPGNDVRSLCEDKDGNIWIGLKGGGLSRYEPDTRIFTKYLYSKDDSTSLSYNDVSAIIEDREERLWVAADRGSLDLYDRSNDSFVHYKIADSTGRNLNNALVKMVIDKRGDYLYLASWGGGVLRFDLEKLFFSRMPADDILCDHVFDLQYDQVYDRLLVSTAHNGLVAVSLADSTYGVTIPVSRRHGLSLSQKSAGSDKDGNIWLGQTIIDGGSLSVDSYLVSSSYGTEADLLSGTVRCIYSAPNGTMWLGHDVGISYYNETFNRFSFVPVTDKSEVVCSILEDRSGDFWVGETYSLKHYRSDWTHDVTYEISDATRTNNPFMAQALLEDECGNIWVGGLSETVAFVSSEDSRLHHLKIENPDTSALPINNILSLANGRDGSIWIGAETGVVNYNPLTGKFTTLFQSKKLIYPEDKARAIFQDQDGFLWVGTEGGLRCFEKEEDASYREIDDIGEKHVGLANDFITSIVEDQDGILWIGTRDGLHICDRITRRFEYIYRDDRAYGDIVQSMALDSNDGLWISTPNEILRYDMNLKRFASFDSSDGLDEIGFSGLIVSSRGNLIIGGVSGISLAKSDILMQENRLNPVVISDVTVMGKPVSTKGGIRLGPKQNMVAFSFVSPNIEAPGRVRYRYILDGMDAAYVTDATDGHAAVYTNLPAGKYIFKVESSGWNGIWDEKGAAQLPVTVVPPFYRSTVAYVFYFLFVLFSICFILRYLVIREKEKAAVEIARLEASQAKEIEKFRTDMAIHLSHEFRTPLSLIIAPLQDMLRTGNYDGRNASVLEMMYRNARRLQRLTGQFLDLRKTQEGTLSIHTEHGDIVVFVSEIARTFGISAKEKGIDYSFISSVPSLEADFDSDKLDKILYNLISNSIKYTPEKGRVRVSLEFDLEHNMMTVKVRDTGIGISESGKRNIFDRFYRDPEASTLSPDGFGVGLYLTKELVSAMSGTISIESQLGVGSLFTVTIPVSGICYESSDSIKDTMGHDRERILVVEDNADMRKYLKSILSSQYDVFEAPDGKLGFKAAVENIPDIIICDVMMPEMDGVQMLAKIRQDQRTSHVPLVLLTARNNEEDVMSGLDAGADDYVTKPFSSAVLLSRIGNLLERRKMLWASWNASQGTSVVAGMDRLHQLDRNFLEEVISFIDSHISDCGFAVIDIASHFHMSIDQLSRKMKALVNSTPGNMILQRRMYNAAERLKEGKMTVSEVAWSVGYNEISNFSRAFKKAYGVSPKDFSRK